MKTTFKKVLSLVLSLTMLFSVAVMPVSAIDYDKENYYRGYYEFYDYGDEVDKDFIDKIKDTYHWCIARVYFLFKKDCPICGEHFISLDGRAQVADKYNEALNMLKNYKGTVTVDKKSTVDVQVKDVPSAVESVLNNIANNFAGTTENSYTFVNRYDEQSVNTINNVIPPANKGANLISKGIHSYEMNKDSIEVKLISEKSKYSESVNKEAVYNAAVVDTLNFGLLDLGTVEITSAEMIYPGTEIYATYDVFGRLSTLRTVMPWDGFATGKTGTISATIGFEGVTTDEYTFNYVS